MFKSVLLYLSIVFSSLSFAQREPQELFIQISYSNWVSVNYLNCLKTQLPCQCEESGELFLIDVDTVATMSVKLYDGEANQDYRGGEIESVVPNNYYVLEPFFDRSYENKLPDTIGRFSIISDTLSYTDTLDRTTKFVKYGDYQVVPYIYGNVTWMNQQLKIRGYNDLQTILNTNNPKFFCNWELGGINLIYDRGKNWILEMENNELVICRWKNPPKEKSTELKIRKKEVARLKW
jgi:hypothetical protein